MHFISKYYQIFIYSLLLLLILLIANLAWVYKTKKIALSEPCFTASEKTVRGHSMEPLFYEGETIHSLLGYYDCHEIKRGDIVLADYGGASFGIILKTVKGLPGDTFTLSTDGLAWNILVNGEVLTTNTGVKYSLPDYVATILKSYENQSAGIVPEGNYLLFGEISEGSFDSTRAGFFPHDSIIAKVEWSDKQ